jgi:hypothetical protein
MKKSLLHSDWTLVFLLSALVVLVVLGAKIKAFQASSTVCDQDLVEEFVVVTIEGAVKRPGSFRVAVGTCLKEVVKKAKPLPFADLKSKALLGAVCESVVLKIEELQEVLVTVCGEAENTTIAMPVGSCVKDLSSKLSLTKDADLSFFKSRRKLKDGEVIEIPKKPVE